MTEEEWNRETNPSLMVRFVEEKASKQKYRLFACACFRMIWQTLDGDKECIRRAVEIGERLAEGMASAEEIASFFTHLETSPHFNKTRTGPFPFDFAAGILSDDTSGFLLLSISSSSLLPYQPIPGPRSMAQCDLLRDIFGNPFRPVSISSAWLTPTCRALAQATYDNRILPTGTLDPDRLAVLADALEDAGCEDAAILEHLRGQGPHVRGCWVLDAILSKE